MLCASPQVYSVQVERTRPTCRRSHPQAYSGIMVALQTSSMSISPRSKRRQRLTEQSSVKRKSAGYLCSATARPRPQTKQNCLRGRFQSDWMQYVGYEAGWQLERNSYSRFVNRKAPGQFTVYGRFSKKKIIRYQPPRLVAVEGKPSTEASRMTKKCPANPRHDTLLSALPYSVHATDLR